MSLAGADETEKKPTDPSGDPTDGSGEDNHGGKESPQQVHNDEDHG
jgi:hypothetical protein